MAIAQQTLAASGTITLGNVSHRNIGSWVIHVTGTWTGSLVPKGKLALTPTPLVTGDRANLGYRAMTTTTLTDPGSSAITANGLYVIPADGVSVELDWTRSSGSIVVDAVPLDG